MSKATDVVAYTYKADVWCPDCIFDVAKLGVFNAGGAMSYGDAYGRVEEALGEWASLIGLNRADEYSFDSDDFPKVIFGSQVNDETWEHCGQCHEHIDHNDRDCHSPECEGCEHDCPWRGNPLGAPYCSICDDHNEARDND